MQDWAYLAPMSRQASNKLGDVTAFSSSSFPDLFKFAKCAYSEEL